MPGNIPLQNVLPDVWGCISQHLTKERNGTRKMSFYTKCTVLGFCSGLEATHLVVEIGTRRIYSIISVKIPCIEMEHEALYAYPSFRGPHDIACNHYASTFHSSPTHMFTEHSAVARPSKHYKYLPPYGPMDSINHVSSPNLFEPLYSPLPSTPRFPSTPLPPGPAGYTESHDTRFLPPVL